MHFACAKRGPDEVHFGGAFSPARRADFRKSGNVQNVRVLRGVQNRRKGCSKLEVVKNRHFSWQAQNSWRTFWLSKRGPEVICTLWPWKNQMAVKTFGVSFLASTGCSDAHGLWGNGVWEGGCWCHCAALSFLQLMFLLLPFVPFLALCWLAIALGTNNLDSLI